VNVARRDHRMRADFERVPRQLEQLHSASASMFGCGMVFAWRNREIRAVMKLPHVTLDMRSILHDRGILYSANETIRSQPSIGRSAGCSNS
jgi:hypothetical protein